MAFGRVNVGESPGDNSSRRNSAGGRKAGKADGNGLTRRAMLAGGLGATALVAVPDMARAATVAGATPARAIPARAVAAGAPTSAGNTALADATSTASGHFFLYGVTSPDAVHSAGIQAVSSPASRSAQVSAPVSVATGLAATPVLSPDQAWLALADVSATGSEPVVTVSIVERTSATPAQKAVIALRGVPADSSILVTPVFSPDSSVVSLVLGISVPSNKQAVRKKDPATGGYQTIEVADWRSEHALAYFDRSTGAVTGPFYLDDGPSLSLSTAVSTANDLFVWTTPDPRATPRVKSHPVPPPLPSVSVFPLGEGKARLRVPSPAPWPAGEPASPLPNGDVARFVNARTLQAVAARNGDITQVTVAALAAGRAKPSPVTMAAQSDGTLFLAKPSVGRAVIVDPASAFAVKHDVSFPAPARPSAGLRSKAVLAPSGDLLYVLGGAKSGGIAVYDVASGKIAAAYGDGRQYSGIYLLPSGTLLAVSPENPRLAYFSPELSPLGTADTSVFVSAVY